MFANLTYLLVPLSTYCSWFPFMIFFHSILFKFVTFFISCSLISTITDLFTLFKTLVTSYPACRTNSTAINKLVPSLYLSTLLQQCCCVGPTFYVMGLRFLMQIYCRLAQINCTYLFQLSHQCQFCRHLSFSSFKYVVLNKGKVISTVYCLCLFSVLSTCISNVFM